MLDLTAEQACASPPTPELLTDVDPIVLEDHFPVGPAIQEHPQFDRLTFCRDLDDPTPVLRHYGGFDTSVIRRSREIGRITESRPGAAEQGPQDREAWPSVCPGATWTTAFEGPNLRRFLASSGRSLLAFVPISAALHQVSGLDPRVLMASPLEGLPPRPAVARPPVRTGHDLTERARSQVAYPTRVRADRKPEPAAEPSVPPTAEPPIGPEPHPIQDPTDRTDGPAAIPIGLRAGWVIDSFLDVLAADAGRVHGRRAEWFGGPVLAGDSADDAPLGVERVRLDRPAPRSESPREAAPWPARLAAILLAAGWVGPERAGTPRTARRRPGR